MGVVFEDVYCVKQCHFLGNFGLLWSTVSEVHRIRSTVRQAAVESVESLVESIDTLVESVQSVE